MDSFYKGLDRLTNGLAAIAGVYLAVIFLAILFQVAARQLAISGAEHVFTFIEYGLLYIAMLAGPWLVRLRGHVYIEFLTASLSPHVQPMASRVVIGLAVIICLVVAWYSGEVTIRNYVRDEIDMRSVDMPRWLLMISMPVGFSLMALQFSRFVFGPETMHTGEAGVHE